MEEEFMDIRRELDKWEDIENHANSTPLQPRQLFHVDFVPTYIDPVTHAPRLTCGCISAPTLHK